MSGSWKERHERSEAWANKAQVIEERGRMGWEDESENYYLLAAREELEAFRVCPANSQRTCDATAVSAISLLLKANAGWLAHRIYCQLRSDGRLDYDSTHGQVSLDALCNIEVLLAEEGWA